MQSRESSARTYCIIGDPIEHSLSPAMQNAAFAALGLNYTYIAFRVPQDELSESVASLKAANIPGFNVTVPLKVDIIKHLDELDETAKMAAAVNTVNNVDGRLKGYNTDIEGFRRPFLNRHLSLEDLKVLLIGAGGAARAVVAALSTAKVATVTIVNRDPARAADLAAIGAKMGMRVKVAPMEDIKACSSGSDLIVNATTLGLHNEKSLLRADDIKKGAIVYDLVYRPVVTDLIGNAKRAQAVVIYGYEMLLEQGALAFEIW
ncbi:MAG TPA: shikimate dehydrogenase, partial [Nitrososphaera sp.]|nr:shikimate dehydrogenase [Nitrososphaera sp.]